MILKLVSIELKILFAFWMLTLNQGCKTNHRSQHALPDPEVRYKLQISKYSNTELTSYQADKIIKNMNRVIQTEDSVDDLPCAISFVRRGAVTPFDLGDGIINGKVDFDVVNRFLGNVKVVNQINWCDVFAPNIIGCAPAPGDSMVVVRIDSDQEGILWLHEFGHNKGLLHRENEFAVMNSTIDPNRRGVNEEECSAFKGSIAEEAFHALMSGAQRLDIKDFVRQTFVHGVPYKEASQYGPEVVSTLLEMLEDPKEEKHWSNIVVTLGIIGDPSTLQPLIDFINRDYEKTLSRPLYAAKTSALMALGYHVNKTGDKKALSYLTRCAQPSFWDKMELQWKSPYHRDEIRRNINMSTVAILGLGLCGRKEAEKALHRHQTRPPTDEIDQRFQTLAGNVVGDAIDTCQTIAKKGIAEYYRKQKHR